MKRLFFFLIICLTFIGNRSLGQTLPGLPGGNSRLKGVLSTVIGSYPQQVDWFNWAGSAWAADKIQKITYNQSGDPLTLEWDLNSGIDTKTTYTYNSNRMPTVILNQEKSGEAWVNVSRTRTEFDSNNNPTLEISEVFQGNTWVMSGGMQFTNEMVDGKLYRMTISDYDLNSAQYVLISRTTFEYGSNGMINAMISETHETGSWVNSIRMNYTWETDGKENIVIVETWETERWVLMGKYVYEWTANDSSSSIFSSWDQETNDYLPMMRDISQNDSHGNLILRTNEFWMGMSWFLSTGSQYDITYQGDNATQRITKKWSGVAYNNETKEVFSSFINLGIDDPTSLFLSLDCFPNPANDVLIIRYNALSSITRSIELVDMLGKTLITQAPQLSAQRLTWDISEIPAGVYLVRMTDNYGQVVIRKIIKQ